MKPGFKIILVTLPVVLAGVAFLAYTVTNKPPPEQIKIAERAVSVRVITAQKSAMSPKASGFGLVSPARTFEAITQVGGTAEYINPLLKKGAILPAGATILRLSATDFNLAIAQANANIRAAEAKLAEIEITRDNLKSALQIEQEVLALKASDLQRIETLFAAGTASQAARDGATAAHLAQRQKAQSLQNSLALLPTQKRAQTEQIAVYQATLDTAELNLARTELKLPFAARVASVSVEVGQLVRLGQTAALFDGIQTAEVEARIPAVELLALFRTAGADTGPLGIDTSTISRVLRALTLKATVRMQIGTEFLEWDARLDRISNSIDTKTGTVGVIVQVDNAYSSAEIGFRPPLTKGMFANVTLTGAPIEGIIIPRSAVRSGKVMLADQQSRMKIIEVDPFLIQNEQALITSNLDEGAQVVVSMPTPVISGLLLETFPDTELAKRLNSAGADQ